MSRTFHDGSRRLRVKAIRREQPDLQKLARALIELAQLQLEAEAEAEHGKTAEADNVVELRPDTNNNLDTAGDPERDAA